MYCPHDAETCSAAAESLNLIHCRGCCSDSACSHARTHATCTETRTQTARTHTHTHRPVFGNNDIQTAARLAPDCQIITGNFGNPESLFACVMCMCSHVHVLVHACDHAAAWPRAYMRTRSFARCVSLCGCMVGCMGSWVRGWGCR